MSLQELETELEKLKGQQPRTEHTLKYDMPGPLGNVVRQNEVATWQAKMRDTQLRIAEKKEEALRAYIKQSETPELSEDEFEEPRED